MAQISSSLGEGTTVALWLPTADGRLTESVPVEPRGSVITQRRGRILVCDDDGDVRSLIAGILRDLGHTIWEANNPSVALQILEREQPIDLLLVDYAMPEMDGLAVIDRARACEPGIKVLLITGFPEALRTNENLEIPVLPKPFKLAELSRRIGEILNGLSSGESAENLKVQH